VIRDPFQYSDATLIVPPGLVSCLEFFDGEHTSPDLRAYLVRATGDLEVGQIEQHLLDALSSAGFLEDETFLRCKEQAERAFAEAPIREPSHAGCRLPDENPKLIRTFNEYLADAPPAPKEKLLAIAAPHVSPFGGVDAYRAAYSALSPSDAGRTFVILGTSHYGAPDRLGLIAKPFATPYGETIPISLSSTNRRPNPATPPPWRITATPSSTPSNSRSSFSSTSSAPTSASCPSCAAPTRTASITAARPEANDHVNRMLGSLGEIAAREGDRLLWVLGIDMAHMGRRYGDSFPPSQNATKWRKSPLRDRARMERMESATPADLDLISRIATI